MQVYPKIPVIINKDYKVEIEPHAGVLWIHCDVKRLTPTSYKSMKETWKEFTDTIDSDLYVLYNPDTNIPSKHYIKSFGFRYFKSLENKTPYQIWKRSK